MEIKGQRDATDWFFIAKLIVRSTCFGHHYAHHQELKCIIQWLLPVVFVLWFSSCWSGLELRVMCPVCRMLVGKPTSVLQTGHIQQPLYNTLELLMMGIMVTETCWASNKICNKKPLLHLVGILFPYINLFCSFMRCLAEFWWMNIHLMNFHSAWATKWRDFVPTAFNSGLKYAIHKG